MWQAEFKLYLYPVDPQYELEIETLVSQLQEIQFIGKQHSEERFSTGDKFAALLTFMGCSPNIELEPQENSAYCYIEIGLDNMPIFISGKNTKYPSCPHCKSKLKPDLEPKLESKQKSVECLNCGKPIELRKLNWRKSAFIAKSWIAIGNIYELEAIPNDQLLDHLETWTGVKWKSAYIRQPV